MRHLKLAVFSAYITGVLQSFPCYGMGKRDYNETIICAEVFKKTISWWDPMRYAGIYGTSWLNRKKKLVSVIKLDITLERK